MGMKELKDVRYLLPPLQGTLPTEMILMVLSKIDGHFLDRDEVKSMIKQIFKNIYERDEDDEILDLILSDLPEMIRLC